MNSKVRLSDIANVNMGQSPKSKYYTEDSNFMPFLQGNRTFGYKTPMFDTFCTKPNKIAKKDSVIMSVRAPVGDLNIAPVDICIGRGVTELKAKDGDNQYLFYILKANQRFLKKSGNGTIFKSIRRKDLENMMLNVPSAEKKDFFTHSLKILDDKYELNLTTINIIEEYFKLLHYKWFVNFNFPNKEEKPYKDNGGKVIEKNGKVIPEGWNFEYLGKGKLSSLLSPGIKEYNSSKKYVTTSNVNFLDIDKDLEETTFEDRTSRANMQPEMNSIWFAKMKDSIKHIFVLDQDIIDNYIFSTGFAGLQCKEKYFPYVASFINSDYFERKKDKLSNGSTQKAINNTGIKNIKIVLPPEYILEKYYEKTYPLFKKIDSLRKQNQLLEETRDLMIKKLIK